MRPWLLHQYREGIEGGMRQGYDGESVTVALSRIPVRTCPLLISGDFNVQTGAGGRGCYPSACSSQVMISGSSLILGGQYRIESSRLVADTNQITSRCFLISCSVTGLTLICSAIWCSNRNRVGRSNAAAEILSGPLHLIIYFFQYNATFQNDERPLPVSEYGQEHSRVRGTGKQRCRIRQRERGRQCGVKSIFSHGEVFLDYLPGKLFRSSRCLDMAVVHDEDPVCNGQDEGEVLVGDQHGELLLLEPCNDPGNLLHD